MSGCLAGCSPRCALTHSHSRSAAPISSTPACETALWAGSLHTAPGVPGPGGNLHITPPTPSATSVNGSGECHCPVCEKETVTTALPMCKRD
ncbi:hypothetical protein FKM82_030660 [Ascaphus truei]